MEFAEVTPQGDQADPNINVLVVAKPGRIRNSLQALLRIMPRLRMTDLASDDVSAMQIVAQYNPALIIMDVDLPECQAWILLAQLKQTQPQIRCLFFVNSIEQRHTAQIAGADAILLKGFGTLELFTTIEQLIPHYQQQEREEHDKRATNH